MLSVTAILLPTEEADAFMAAPWIADWKHRIPGWGTVRRIDVPDLSMKEKMLIDRHINMMDDYGDVTLRASDLACLASSTFHLLNARINLHRSPLQSQATGSARLSNRLRFRNSLLLTFIRAISTDSAR